MCVCVEPQTWFLKRKRLFLRSDSLGRSECSYELGFFSFGSPGSCVTEWKKRELFKSHVSLESGIIQLSLRAKKKKKDRKFVNP